MSKPPPTVAPLPPPLPLTVISGYLGSGKTTLVNQLLRGAQGRRIMVMVNDFGDIALDAELIEARDGDSITLANGCICCSIGGGLFQAFGRALDRRPRPDHLVIEASGVAEPRRIAAIADAEPELRRDLIVTLADALNCQAQLADPLIGDSLERQIEAADLLIVNKTDLVTDDAVTELGTLLAAFNPNATQVRVERGAIGLDLLLGPIVDSAAREQGAATRGPAHIHETLYRRWSFSSPDCLDRAGLEQFFERLPPGILRLKGISHGPEADDLTEFHLAGRHREIRGRAAAKATAPGLRMVAIGHKDAFDGDAMEKLASELLPPAEGKPERGTT